MSEPLHHMLERNARKYPDDIGIRHPETETAITWRELNAFANALAHYLKINKIKKDDKVAVVIPNQPEFLIAFFAILKAGAVAVPVNVRLTPPEIKYILSNSDACAVLYEDSLRATIEEAVSENVKFVLSAREFGKVRAEHSQDNLEMEIYPSDIAEIIYTSGTTGKPKGVLLTHQAIYGVGTVGAYEGGINYRDRVLLLMPLSHSAPLNLYVTAGVFAGATLVLGTFSPQNLLEYVAREKTTHFFGAPVCYILANKVPNFHRYDLSSAKYWIYGGAAASKENVLMIYNNFPGKLRGVYGLTEAGPNGIALRPEEHPQYGGSVGKRASPNTEVRLVDNEEREVKAGETGEVLIKSFTLMKGYYKNKEATREVFFQGWLRTGDLAWRDDEGYYWILDRKKDMIISGGVNIYPREIEDVLCQYPGIADVAVLGVPHKDWGETVMAVIVPQAGRTPTLEEIRSFAGKYLADYKLPRIVKCADVIPRSPAGKILKKELRNYYMGKDAT